MQIYTLSQTITEDVVALMNKMNINGMALRTIIEKYAKWVCPSPHRKELYKHLGHDTKVFLHCCSIPVLELCNMRPLDAWPTQSFDSSLSKSTSSNPYKHRI